jgi:hypothetical protein
MAPDKRGVVMWKSSRQYIRWIAGLTLLGTMLGGGWVACWAADDSGDDRLSRLDRRGTREARAERDDRRTAAAESPGYQRERTGSFFQRLSSGGPTRPSLRGFNGRDDHGNDIDGATALSSVRPARGELETEGDSDYFSFRADRGVSYVIEARLLSHPDTVMELLDRNRNRIESDDDGGNYGGSRIEWTAPDDGTYYVVVRGYDSGYTGTYALSLER